ncbi:MAG TPA: TIGR03943 family protein [Mycobacterium sp.]|nr:TIGR03943 family protein [Mycobacterium sp.]
MSREAENTLLLLVGIATAMITIGGAFTRYVKPSMLPWLGLTAAVVIGLALVAMAVDIRRGVAHGDHGDHENPGPHGDHTHRGSVAWLLLLPVVVLIFIAPPALRPQAFPPSVTAVSTDVLRREFPPIPDGRAPEVAVPEVMVRAAQDTAGTLDNRLITVVGFTLREPDGVDLGRVAIVCCAADARLARIHLRGPAAAEAAALPDETWVRVEGTVITGSADGDSTSIPTLEVAKVTPIDEPANTYA